VSSTACCIEPHPSCCSVQLAGKQPPLQQQYSSGLGWNAGFACGSLGAAHLLEVWLCALLVSFARQGTLDRFSSLCFRLAAHPPNAPSSSPSSASISTGMSSWPRPLLGRAKATCKSEPAAAAMFHSCADSCCFVHAGPTRLLAGCACGPACHITPAYLALCPPACPRCRCSAPLSSAAPPSAAAWGHRSPPCLRSRLLALTSLLRCCVAGTRRRASSRTLLAASGTSTPATGTRGTDRSDRCLLACCQRLSLLACWPTVSFCLPALPGCLGEGLGLMVTFRRGLSS
jgi:hypothetical protein